MDSLNDYIAEYKLHIRKGIIQKAYRGIMVFMAELRTHLKSKYPEHTLGSLYMGYMDMSYFAFTPSSLKDMKLKIAIVFLHEECRFELWLSGTNRKIQREYVELLKNKNLMGYALSDIKPGVDSIVETVIVKHPDFDDPGKLKIQIEKEIAEFIENIMRILSGDSMDSEKELIAPCGMNCALCANYQAMKNDLKHKGFHKKYCPGCLSRGKNCVYMGDQCELLGKGLVRFCYECKDFPCKRLKSLDKRYRTKYHMSMIANLEYIQEHGFESFLENEKSKWRCPDCGDMICCHNGLCMNCDLDKLRKNKKYRWGEE